MSKAERQGVMTDVSDNLLNETALQYSTTSIGDMKNVEVEENEINIGIAEHEVTQEKEVGVENGAACIDDAIANVEGIDVGTTKEGTRKVNAEERLVLKRLREIFETKAYGDIPSVKTVDWKRAKREVELVNSITVNMKTNSESEDTKLLASLLAAEMIGVKTTQKSEKSRRKLYWKRIMLKLRENILVCYKKFARE